MNLLTNSRMAAFRFCPRSHYLRYEVGIAPDQDEFALRVGTTYHAAHEAADLGLDPDAAVSARGDLDPWDAAMVAAMFTVHRERWAGDTIKVVATELPFEIPLRNPETGAESRVWRLAGKIDRIYQLPDGRLALLDRKTTSADIDPGSDFWLQLRLDQQMPIYLLAARELGYDVQTIEHDVTVRPMQRPFKATPIEERKYTQKATKLSDGTVRPAGSLYTHQRADDESPWDFAARVADAMRADPVRYFARHEMAILDGDLDEIRAELWSQQLAMREAQRSDRWFRNPSACVTPTRRCPYLSICKQRIDRNPLSVPEGFQLLPDVHRELTASPGQAGQKV